MAGPQTFHVDQAATFTGVVLLSCEPKTKMGSSEQDKTKDGVSKWELQCVAGFRSFGRADNTILKVTVAAHSDPAAGVNPYTPVELIGFQVGVMERRNAQGEITGAQVWYRAEEVRSTGCDQRAQAERRRVVSRRKVYAQPDPPKCSTHGEVKPCGACRRQAALFPTSAVPRPKWRSRS